jgi:hypothetical protein
MNAVSSAVSWDATLRRLGLHPAESIAPAAALGGQGLTIELDSTKRKRRKQMKKHKVRKMFVCAFSFVILITGVLF